MGRKLTIGGCKLLKLGGASRDRTDDLIVANDALSQLSYSPTSWKMNKLDFISGADFLKTEVHLARSSEESVAPTCMMGIVSAPGKTLFCARSSAWNASVSSPEGGVAGRKLPGADVISTAESLTILARSALSASMFSSGSARTSISACASAGITLMRKPPLMIVGTSDVRSME